jgi:hypothetical protein
MAGKLADGRAYPPRAMRLETAAAYLWRRVVTGP